MVFESIVVELINRYLGTFVENLDTSQLKIGIWGASQGDVVLNNLNLQESALDDLDLPVKIKAGHISKLTLKIPWKNLYTEPVVAYLDGIYALAVPNVAIKYDAVKEEKAEQESKQAKLAKIEEQRKLEAEKNKPKDPKKDSFAEKLATQVIKNLQVKVANIHVRYEDKYTNPIRPFAIGVTLQELLFQTTDSNWKETVIKEAVTQIFKLVRLDSLSVYWNSQATLYQDQSKTEILKVLSNNVPKQGKKTTLQYLFRPISAVAHLRLNTKPELTDFSMPKLFLTLVFDEIAISLAKNQYDDVLEMLESLERMALLGKYKKTRPSLDYSDTKPWWRHAYASILEHTVQRRRKMWSWTNIKQHRDLVRQYRTLYTRKLDAGGGKLSSADNALIKSCEEKLDVFNISLCRNQAEMDAERLGKKRQEEKESKGGWLGGWFGGGKKDKKKKDGEDSTEDSGLGAKFQEEFNNDEKAKLYQAIGYDENAKDPTFPIEYVAMRLVTKLNKLSVSLTDGKLTESQLMKLSLTEICASFGQRPAAKAIRLDAKVERLRVNGIQRGDYLPKLVSSVGVSKEENGSLLMLAVETNPQDGLCDSRIRMQSRPLEIIYDAITVNNLANFFKPPESVRLKQLSNMAMARYDVIKAQTAAGMMHMMEERKYADIEVNLMPSYIIVPAKGELQKDVCMLLLNLGSFNINSEKTAALTPGAQYTQQELENYSYDKFNISLDNLQLLYIQPGDSWQDENRLATSPLYLLRPLSVKVMLEKCVFANDPKLPQIRLSGELPLISMTISDNKLLGVMKLVKSIPLPESSESKTEEVYEETVVSADARMNMDDAITIPMSSTDPNNYVSELTNFTKVSLSFIIREITAELRETKDDLELPFLRLSIHRIGVKLKARTYDLSMDAFLGSIYLQHLQYKVAEGIRAQLAKCNVITGELINIINSPDISEDEHLLSVTFLQADTKGPEFKTTYNSTAQAVSIEFSTLELVLHQGVVLSLLEFAQRLQPKPGEQAPKPAQSSVSVMRRKSSIASSSITLSRTRKKKETELFQMRLKALIDGVQLGLCNESAVIMHTRIAGIEVGMGMQEAKTKVEAIMRQIELLDPDLNTHYPEIVSVYGEEMLKFELMQYNEGTVGENFNNVNNCDLDVKLNMGRARIVFINKFVKSLTNFLDNFSVAKARLDKAGQALKEAGKDVTKSLQEQAPRIRLTIKIKAPVIVVPRSSKSPEAVLLNLGDISVISTHQLAPGSDSFTDGHANVVENLIAELTNVRLSRAKLGHAESVISEVTIIEPMTFKVVVKRNLSTAWFHGIPDVEVSGIFNSIFIRISQEDVKLFALLAVDNLEEPDPINPNYKPAPRENTPDANTPLNATGTGSETMPALSLSQVETDHSEPYSNLKVDFKLMSISVELYRGQTALTHGLLKRDPSRKLSVLMVHLLKVDLDMMSDSSMDALVSLQDFTLDDCRTEKKGGITKMISQASFNKSNPNAVLEDDVATPRLISLKFNQNNQRDKIMLANISSIHICVCLEFLMKVSDFFLKALPPAKPKTIEEATQAQAAHDQKTGESKMSLKPTTSSSSPAASEQNEGSLDFTLKLGKPEIFLIEDQMNPHTDSLIVDVEVDFRLRMNPDALSINGNIRGLSLVSCVFGSPDTKKAQKKRIISKREKALLEIAFCCYRRQWRRLPTLHYVLSPVDIMVIGNGPMGKDQHIDVSMSDFIMTVSPATIRLLSAVAGAMSVPSDEETVVPEQEDFSKIWDKRHLKDCSFWFTNSVVDLSTGVDEATLATELNANEELTRGEQIRKLSRRSSKLRLELVNKSSDVLSRLRRVSSDIASSLRIPLKQLLVSAPNIVLKLEGGVGHRTVPLLIVESSFTGQVRNWSSEKIKLYIESTLGLEVAYNNESIGVWEPIIEPVMDTKGSYHKWTIGLEVIKPEDNREAEDEDSNILPPPKLTVNVTAVDPIQILMTKTCLDVLNNLGAAFSAAYKLQDMEGSLGQKIVPYLFKNRTGRDMAFILDSSFVPSKEHGKTDLSRVRTDEDVYMDTQAVEQSGSYQSVIRSTQNQRGKNIKFQMSGESTQLELPIQQARKILYNLSSQVQVVATIEALIGQKLVTFTSCVMVTNYLELPMEVVYHDTSGMVPCGVAYPNQPFPVPLAAVYCSTGEIFFQPKNGEENGATYTMSKECVKWRTLSEPNKVKQMSCESSEQGAATYFFNIMAVFENILQGGIKGEKKARMVNLQLHPTVILHNLLPAKVTYSLETLPYDDDDEAKYHFHLRGEPDVTTLESGLHTPLAHASVNRSQLSLQIPQYRGLAWTAKKTIKLDVPELSVLSFEADDSGKPVYMDLGLHCKERNGSFDLSVYSPYWIINLTEQDLAFKEDDKEAPLVHSKEDKDIMLFFYRDKPMFGSGSKRKFDGGSGDDKVSSVFCCGCRSGGGGGGASGSGTHRCGLLKRRVMLRVAEAEWSDKFSLDTAGSGGNVTCKVKATGGTMEVGLNIKLGASGLTKIATFTPFYLLQNAATLPICIREESAYSPWMVVEPSQCVPYYPKVAAKEIKVVAKVNDPSCPETLPFVLNKAHTTLLRLGDKHGGINADCRVSENQMITVLKTYKPGMATVQLVNHTRKSTVIVKQIGSTKEAIRLEPETSQLYTWDNPVAKREVSWTCGKKEGKSALDRDQLEDFFADSDTKVYFVSFLDGMQRVVMFTEDLALATVAQEAGELEQVDQEINLRIHDMGFSLINNEKLIELAYMGITSSGVIWEEKKKRLKAMKLKDMAVLEHAYQKYLNELSAGKGKPVVMLENKLEVDFEKMEMLKPRECVIRRSFSDGIWIQMRTSPHSRQLHAKINRLQFDNQLRHAVFQTILAPQPLPKSVASDSVPKPFVEVSVMTRIHEHSDLVQVKYFKVLVQEMNLQVDQGFLNEIMALFASDVSTQREQEVVAFTADMESTKRDLKEEAGVSMKAKSVTFYDYFHVSPIKVHLSFSMQAVGGSSDTAQVNVFGVFLQSVGVVLTDIQDVVFKLGYFERNHSFYNNSQLTGEFIRHYSRQAIMQVYRLVLGLDGLGNPFGLLVGLSEGIEDLFYEPYQGAVQGPEEFAEGLALGVRSLFGHAVGGAAGAVSRITGTLGKGLAALTLDDDYQKKRREQLNKRPATAREGFARGGKGLVMGVFDGVTGIVRKPVEGAKQEGVAGFFKGMGKGIVGVVTRPTSGVVDFASSSLEGIRRITDVNEEVHRLRPPRIFKKDGIVRPYVRLEAEGHNLLYETDKGQYSETDDYVTHVMVKGDGKTIFILTDKRLMLAKRGELFGAWDSEWAFTFEELKAVPKQIPKGIEIMLKDPRKKNFFSNTVTKKEVHILDAKVAAELLATITATMESKRNGGD